MSSSAAPALADQLRSCAADALATTDNPAELELRQAMSHLAAEEPPPLRSSFGRLEKEALLGGGGYASVWRVREEGTEGGAGGVYALKQVRKGHLAALGAAAIERMKEEKAVHAAVCGHPCIARLYGAAQDEESVYLLLELCEGGDLFSLLAAHPRGLPEACARHHGASVALALQHVHALNFLYRDLKPENILLDGAGHARLADFGLAKQQGHVRAMTRIGTEEYVPPEVLLGRGRTAASDWWALGVLLHELLAGRAPFAGDDAAATFAAIAQYSQGGPARRAALRAELEAPPDACLSPAAVGATLSLLEPREEARLACGAAGFLDLVRNAFFAPIDFAALLRRELPPPCVPAGGGCAVAAAAAACDEEVLAPRAFDREQWAPSFASFGPRVEVGEIAAEASHQA